MSFSTQKCPKVHKKIVLIRLKKGAWYCLSRVFGNDVTVANNSYLYNDKELNTEFGLNLSDYGARWYDAAIGRWWSVDPLAMDYAYKSTYDYAENSPIANIDLDGLEAVPFQATPLNFTSAQGYLERGLTQMVQGMGSVVDRVKVVAFKTYKWRGNVWSLYYPNFNCFIK